MPIDDTPTQTVDQVEAKKYSTQAAADHQFVVDELRRIYGDNVSAALISDLVNSHAARWVQEHGSYPTGSDLVRDERLNRVLGQHASGLLAVLPIGTVTIDDLVYFNDPFEGVIPTGAMDPRAIPAGLGRSFDRLQEFSTFVPRISSEQLREQLARVRPTSPAGGGGGGGGGGARPAVFDLEQISESYRKLHRSLLLEDPGNSVELAKRYQAEYRAFARAGGSLDFQTWAMKQIRSAPRYGVLYAKKPDFLEESDYMNQYFQPAAATGLTANRIRQETEAGLMSGASAAGFSERVSRTQGTDTGGAGFGRRLANLASQMQLGVT